MEQAPPTPTLEIQQTGVSNLLQVVLRFSKLLIWGTCWGRGFRFASIGGVLQGRAKTKQQTSQPDKEQRTIQREESSRVLDLFAGSGSVVQYSIVQYSIVQYSIVQYSIVQYSILQYSIVQYSIAQYSIVQYSIVQYSIVQYSIVQYSIVQYSIVQYSMISIVQCSLVRYSILQYSRVHCLILYYVIGGPRGALAGRRLRHLRGLFRFINVIRVYGQYQFLLYSHTYTRLSSMKHVSAHTQFILRTPHRSAPRPSGPTARSILAIFYPFSQFCEIDVSLASL